MMHTLGDVEKPLSDSVEYIGTILRDQMNLLLIKASAGSGSKALTHAHLLKLLVKQKEKLYRLLHYLFLKDTSEFLGRGKYGKIFEAVNNTQFGARVKTCLEFLRTLGAEDYDPQIIKSSSDDIALERIRRRFQMAGWMSNEQYLEFSEKTRVCFYPKGDRGKFKNWLLVDKVTHLQPTPLALDILSFFARETVAELVEACLLVNRSKKHIKLDLDIPTVPLENTYHSTEDQPDILRDSVPSSSSFHKSDESPRSKKRKTETAVSDRKSNHELEVKISQVSLPESNLTEPKIPPRDPDDPITERDIKSVVRNLILVWVPGKFQISKKKNIICLGEQSL